MKRKIISLLLCLALAVSGITAAAAQDMETITTITMKSGPMMAELADVAQILDIAAIRIHSMPEGYGAFVLSLNDQDALQCLFKVQPEGVFVQSGVFGAQPLYFAWEDLKNFLMKQLEANADMQAAGMPVNMDILQGLMDGTVTEDQILQMMGVDEELMTLMSDIESRKVTESGSFAVQGSDEATLKTQVVLTGDDVVRVIDLPVVRQQIGSQLMTSNPDATQEDIDRMVEEQLTQIKQSVKDANIAATITAYTKEDALIAFTFDMTAQISDYSGGFIPIGVNATLTRTTIDTAKFYQLAVTLSQADQQFNILSGSLFIDAVFTSGQLTFYAAPGEPLFEAAFNCDKSQADNTSGELSLTLYDSYSGEAQSVYLTFDQTRAENVADTTIDVYLGGAVDAIKSALADTNLISIKINTVTQPDSGFFAALQNATPEASVQLLQMTDAELQTYMQTMQQGLMTTVLTIIDNLPPDISNALMQSMGGSF
jgi:hypothetical protein